MIVWNRLSISFVIAAQKPLYIFHVCIDYPSSGEAAAVHGGVMGLHAPWSVYKKSIALIQLIKRRESVY